MNRFSLQIPPEYDGKDIKFIIQNHFKLSKKMMTRLKKDNGILLNGRKEFVTKAVHTGDTLLLSPPNEVSENIVPENIPLEILYVDEYIYAVNKPANMPTHPSINHYSGTLANACAYHFRDTPFTFRAITRLDRDTTGVVLLAKNAHCAYLLSKSMQEGKIQKEYNALCVGIPAKSAGNIVAPIAREQEGVIKRCVSPNGKYAKSIYETLSEKDGFSFIRLMPLTGRTHQLRVHLSYIGTPIYGDFLYGSEIDKERRRRHCRSITFEHPISGKKITISAPVPDDMNLNLFIGC